MGSITILPDSRPRERRGLVLRNGAWWTPVFCANCGADGGLVPEEGMTFAFYLCNPCAETHGEIQGTVMIPDEVFWQKLREEQLEKYGRLLSPEELHAVAQSNTSPLATLIREGR